MAVSDFDAKESARCRRVLAVTEFVVSGTQCTYFLTAILQNVTSFVAVKTYGKSWIRHCLGNFFFYKKTLDFRYKLITVEAEKKSQQTFIEKLRKIPREDVCIFFSKILGLLRNILFVFIIWLFSN